MTANLKESSSSNSEVELVSTGSNRLSVELPFVSKYLLIAAYLASYNPVSSDKRFFMKAGGKIKKLKNTVAAAARIAQHKRTSQLLGKSANWIKHILIKKKNIIIVVVTIACTFTFLSHHQRTGFQIYTPFFYWYSVQHIQIRNLKKPGVTEARISEGTSE